MRYVLPIAPALALLAGYGVSVEPAGGALRHVRDAALGLCRAIPPVALLAAVAGWFIRERFDPPLVAPYLPTACALAGVLILGEAVRAWQKDKMQRAMVVLASATAAFNVFFVGIVGPASYSREDTGPFVARVEAMRREQPGPIAFYRIDPGSLDLKFVVNMERVETPLFADSVGELLAAGSDRGASGVYIVTEESDFRALPVDVAARLDVRLRGRLGHKQCVVLKPRPE